MHGRAWSLLAFLLLGGCRGEPATQLPDAALKVGERTEKSAVAPAPSAPAQPGAELDVDAAPAHAAPKEASAALALPNVKVPARGCAVRQARTLRTGASQVRVSGSLAVVLLADKQTFELWTTDESEPRMVASQREEYPVDNFSVNISRGTTRMLTWVDSHATLWWRHVGKSFGKAARIDEGVDRRFAPAQQRGSFANLIAYTKTVDDVMHTFVTLRPSDQREKSSDITPEGHGAAAPTFILGASEPTLVAIDARAGVSPLLEIPIDGPPANNAIVRTPVSQPYAPPLLRAVALPPTGEVEVAFTALGRLAATAIGRVPLRKAVGPVPLHPSTGYGQLSFDAALTKKGAVFAMEEPINEKPDAPHRIEVKWVDAKGEGKALAITDGKTSARLPSLSAITDDGELALAYLVGDAVQWLRLRCE